MQRFPKHAKKILFIVGSSYSLLNAIHVARSALCAGKEKHLVVFKRDEMMGRVANKLRVSGIFVSVSTFRYINNVGTAWKVLTFIFPSFFLKFKWLISEKSDVDLKNFDVVVTQSNFYASLFKLLNVNAIVIHLDEGLSSYTGKSNCVKRRSLLARFFSNVYSKNAFHFAFLYSKHVYVGPPVEITTIPKLTLVDLTIYKDFFDYVSPIINPSRNVCYLSAPFWGERVMLVDKNQADGDFESRCASVVETVISEVGAKNIIHRPHPIENELDLQYAHGLYIDKGSNLWELYAGLELTDRHVIVSIFSTGALTPWLLFNKQPVLVFLFKLIGPEFLGAEKVVNALKKQYAHPEKIHVPETISELKHVLSNCIPTSYNPEHVFSSASTPSGS